MARPLRITFPGAFYHVTSRGNERKAVFTGFILAMRSRRIGCIGILSLDISDEKFQMHRTATKNLCLQAIGANFGISESAVSHACRRVTDRIRRDSKLRKRIEKMDKKLNRSKFKS